MLQPSIHSFEDEDETSYMENDSKTDEDECLEEDEDEAAFAFDNNDEEFMECGDVEVEGEATSASAASGVTQLFSDILFSNGEITVGAGEIALLKSPTLPIEDEDDDEEAPETTTASICDTANPLNFGER